MKLIYLFIIIILIPLIFQKEFLSISEKPKLNSFESNLDLEAIRKNILTNHNKYRKLHQVEDLKRNSDIEKIAQEYSEYLASINKLVHSKNTYKGSSLGENLYGAWGTTLTGTDASEDWYSESADYDYNNPGYTSGIGHFTQLVWKGSKEIGCGAACNGGCFITCNYYPAGNILNTFASNVFPISENQSNFSEKKGMSTAGKVFLTIFILLLVAIIVFALYHFVYRKRSFNELKDYFKCFNK